MASFIPLETILATCNSTVFQHEDLNWSVGSKNAASAWRHICAMASGRILEPRSWPEWRVQGQVEEDLLSYCIREGRSGTFADLADLAFVFHWAFLEISERTKLESVFKNALDLCDTRLLLDVVPDTEPFELINEVEAAKRRDVQIRSDSLKVHLTQATIAYLRRVPVSEREAEWGQLKNQPFLDMATKNAIDDAYMLMHVNEEYEAFNEIESKARSLANSSRRL
jgi:hypothetical protein